MKQSNTNAQTPTMPPEGQTQKDIPLKEDSNTSPVDDDLKMSSLSQMQTAILLLTQLVGQQKLLVHQGSYAPSRDRYPGTL